MSDLEDLHERYLDAFFAAWPEHTITRDEASATLSIVVERDSDEATVKVHFGYMGSDMKMGFDGSADDLARTVDDMAQLSAENAEGDRWIAGDGWREYRP